MPRRTESFDAMVRREEIKIFPDCFPKGRDRIPTFQPPEEKGSGWCYYPPSFFAQNGLLDQVMLERMKAGGKLLSIGAGPAYLERFLVGMGSNRENIVLGDLSDRHIPDGFTRHTFDARENDWPDFGTRFDFVIYPECFSIINGDYEDLESGHNAEGKRTYYGCTREDYARVFGRHPYADMFNTVSPALSGTWHLIQKGLEQLNPDGEVRASLVGPNAIKAYDPYNQLDYLREHLQRQFGATIEDGRSLRVKLSA